MFFQLIGDAALKKEVPVADLDDWEGEINGLLTAVNRASVRNMPK